MAAQLSVEALVDMFSSLSTATVRDVVEQCGNNCEVAMEHLLTMADSPSQPERVAPAPAAPRTREAAFAMLFPREKKASPTRAEHAASRLSSLTFTLTDSTTALTTATGCTALGPGPGANSLGWLPGVVLDTGQPPGPAFPVRRTAAVSRGWWPKWHSSHAAACTGVPLPQPSPLPSAAAHGPPSAAWSAADNLLNSCKYRTPPRGRPPATPIASAAGPGRGDRGYLSMPSGVPLPTPLQDHDELPCPGHRPVATEGATPCHSDDELAELFPGLAHVLASPSPSGTCSPQLQAAVALRGKPVALGLDATAAAQRLSGPVPPGEAATAAAERLCLPPCQECVEDQASRGQVEGLGASLRTHRSSTPDGDGFDAAALVQAMDSHLEMFPNLKAEVVADVLQRHADAPQTALSQLVMLHQCVVDAASTAAAAGDLPDASAWVSCSGSEDDHSGGGGAGASWAQDLTPEELAAMELGLFPPDLQQGQQLQQPATCGAAAAAADGLSQQEQLAALTAEFAGVAGRDVAEALGACDGDLFAAAELLRTFAAEDAAAAAGGSSAGLNGGMLLGGVAGAAATVPVPAALPDALPEPGGSSLLPQHVAPKVQHLARRFPEAPTEPLQVALAAASYDLVAARRTLRENGYSEVEVAPSPAASTTCPPPPPGLPLPQAVTPSSPPQPVPLPGAAQAPSVPPAPLSLSEATYQRNQSIFEQERAHANRLQAAYRRCYALAQEKQAAGELDAAAELHMKGHEYKQQYEEERRKASRRISMRVNQAGSGGLPRISVDLHGSYVPEALETVDSGIRNLPESIPGGVVVRYITGKGLHSAEGRARLKPEVIALLQERGVPHHEGPGWVEATLLPAA